MVITTTGDYQNESILVGGKPECVLGARASASPWYVGAFALAASSKKHGQNRCDIKNKKKLPGP